jgi:amidohydrolase
MEELKEFVIRIRRHIHENPELGYQTFKTAIYIKQILNELGYQTFDIVDKAGVIGRLDLHKKKTIGLRSDIDALPIEEQTSLPFKSHNGCMHACGHDGHIAMLLGGAKLIVENKDQISCNVVLIFQPAEEGPLPGGAVKVIASGLVDDVDMFFAFHVTNKLLTGQTGIKLHEACAAPDLWELEITGKGCHGSAPANGINPIMPAAEIILSFQKLWDDVRLKDPNTVISTTYMQSGVSMNIIMDKAYLKGTARSFSQEMRDYLNTEMGKTVKEVCAKYHAEGNFLFHYAYPPLFNDSTAAAIAKKAQEEVLGAGNSLVLDQPEMIGEDFASYRKIAPICFSWIGVRGPNQDFYDLHSSHFLLDENALESGARIYFQLAKDFSKE